MEDYNKLLESIGVRFLRAKNAKVIKTHIIEDFYDVENVLILIHNGEYSLSDQEESAGAGDIIFIPAGKNARIKFGSGKPDVIGNDQYINNNKQYIHITQERIPALNPEGSFSIISFEAKIFESVNFYSSLDLPPFILKKDEGLKLVLLEILKEVNNSLPGNSRVLKSFIEIVVIQIFRYLLANNLFVEKMATNISYFKDQRVIDIFNYIKDNLNSNLSNSILANIANVSEDYVGQYFKSMTGINPQDYIEFQRMERSVKLLRTTKMSIRMISAEVGFKDTAYFCRRFKMMFGISAGKMRKRESLINL